MIIQTYIVLPVNVAVDFQEDGDEANLSVRNFVTGLDEHFLTIKREGKSWPTYERLYSLIQAKLRTRAGCQQVAEFVAQHLRIFVPTWQERAENRMKQSQEENAAKQIGDESQDEDQYTTLPLIKLVPSDCDE